MNKDDFIEDVLKGRGRLVDAHAEEWERTYSMFTHLSLLAFHFGIPLVPAVVLWLIKREKSPFIDDHGREAINFQLSLLIYTVGIVAASFVTCGAALVLYVPLYVLAIAGMIISSMAANKGQFYRYPMTIRFF